MVTTNIFQFLVIFLAELDYFTPKYHILYTIGNVLYIILWTTHRQKFTPLYPHLQIQQL